MGRGKSAKTLQLIDASRRIPQEIQPATVRAVCYRLFTEGLIPNMGKSATGGVSKQLVYARENDLIPWEWIVDETREAERINAWNDPVQILRATVNQYRKDYWQFQRYRVEVWSEKGTVRGTVAPVLEKYGVTFRVMHGYGSATALYDVTQESVEVDKPLIVLYIGDWDCSGLHMSEIDLPARLARYGGEASIQRIALSAEDGPGLPSFPASDKANDSRYQWFVERYGDRCWEVDALSPVILRQRLEAHIRAYLDTDAWAHAVKIEQAEIASMREHFTAMESILRPAAKYSERGD